MWLLILQGSLAACGSVDKEEDPNGERISLEVLEVWPPDLGLVREADFSLTAPDPSPARHMHIHTWSWKATSAVVSQA